MKLSLSPKKSFPEWRKKSYKGAAPDKNSLEGYQLQAYLDKSVIGNKLESTKKILEASSNIIARCSGGSGNGTILEPLFVGPITPEERAWEKLEGLLSITKEKRILALKEFPSEAAPLRRRSWALSDFFRFIWAPNDSEKSEQRQIADRLSRIPSHRNSWGFARGKSCLGACNAHLTYWGSEGRGDVSFLSVDIKDFFSSITGTMVDQALIGHGVSRTETDLILESCLMPVGAIDLFESEGLLYQVGCAYAEARRRFRFRMGMPNFGFDRHTSYLAFLDKLANSVVQSPLIPDEDPGSRGNIFLRATKLPIRAVEQYLISGILGMGNNVKLGDRVLIQGSPASPTISNLVMKILDMRMVGLSKSVECYYSRYADDIIFSWKGRRTKREMNLIVYSISKIIKESGFGVNPRKIEFRGPGAPQCILGYNINSGRPTISKKKRRNVWDLILRAERGELAISEGEMSSLRGTVAYFATAHADEAREMDDRLKTISDHRKSIWMHAAGGLELTQAGHGEIYDFGEGAIALPWVVDL